jgi:hypothetical protein
MFLDKDHCLRMQSQNSNSRPPQPLKQIINPQQDGRPTDAASHNLQATFRYMLCWWLRCSGLSIQRGVCCLQYSCIVIWSSDIWVGTPDTVPNCRYWVVSTNNIANVPHAFEHKRFGCIFVFSSDVFRFCAFVVVWLWAKTRKPKTKNILAGRYQLGFMM